jgi:hypothetical protein
VISTEKARKMGLSFSFLSIYLLLSLFAHI